MKLTDAQIARVRSLEDREGRLTPALVVNDAKRKDSPLHSLFEWNMRRAAEVHWLDRAREVIGSVQLIVTTETTTIKTSKYLHDPEAKGQGYRTVEALRANPMQARESLIYTLEIASGHLRRAFDLAAPLGLSGEIDALLDRVAGVRRNIQNAA